jgi:hypothetical protein
MPTRTRAEMGKTRVGLFDQTLLIVWVWAYALLLYGFGLVKRFEKASAGD